jgi:hypothetical protein
LARHGDDVPEDERVLPDDTDEVKKAKEEKAKVLFIIIVVQHISSRTAAAVPYAVRRRSGGASLAHRCLSCHLFLTHHLSCPPAPSNTPFGPVPRPRVGTHSV